MNGCSQPTPDKKTYERSGVLMTPDLSSARESSNHRPHNGNHDHPHKFWIVINNSMHSAQFSITVHHSPFTSLRMLYSLHLTPLTPTSFKPDKLDKDIVRAIKRYRPSYLDDSFVDAPLCNRFFEQIIPFGRSQTSKHADVCLFGMYPVNCFPLRKLIESKISFSWRPSVCSFATDSDSHPAFILSSTIPNKLDGFCIHFTNAFSFSSNLSRQYSVRLCVFQRYLYLSSHL
jgi:hypothetical protein